MSFRSVLLPFFFAVFCISAKAQPITFEKFYDFGNGYGEEGYCVQQTSDSGYIVVGRQTTGIGFSKMLLQKTNPYGQTQWYKLIGSPYESEGYSVKKTFDRGYIITGYTTDINYTNFVYLVKTDSIGDTLWTKRNISSILPQPNGGPGNGYGNEVVQTTDSGFATIANINDYDTTRISILIKTNSVGDTLWTKKFRRLYGVLGNSLKETSDGGFIISGEITTAISPSPTYDIYLIKTNSIGDTLWTKILSAPNNEGSQNVVQTFDGGYLIRGNVYYFSSSSTDIYIVKTNNIGDTLWTKKIGGTSNEGGYGMQQTIDGGYIISGTTTSFGNGSADVYLVKTNSSGIIQWYKTFGGINNDYGDFVQQTSDRGFIISGNTANFGDGGSVYLIKTDSNGFAITGIPSLENSNQGAFLYPNPMITTATLQINHSVEKQPLNFSLYDYTGREIKHMEDISQDQIQISRDDLASGIYIYRLIDKDQKIVASGKLVVE